MCIGTHERGMGTVSSLYDVAALAGVSKTLVSRLINGQPGVSEASREKIVQAMQQLEYVPNALARSLARRETGTIGVVLDSLCEPYFFDFIHGVETAIDNSQYDVLFCSGRNDVALKERSIQYFSEGRADGIISYGSNLSDVQLIQRMSKRTFPFVVVENEAEFTDVNSIIVDNKQGAEMAVDHLVSLGCRNIWHFTGDMRRTISLSRRDGYKQGMKKYGLPVTPHMIVESDFESQAGYLQTKQLLRSNPDALPDGIFFAGDVTAFGALLALQEAGISVPERVKVVGFDNDINSLPNHNILGLTTLSQPLFDMGVEAVKLLIASIRESSRPKETKIFVPSLVVRESTVR